MKKKLLSLLMCGVIGISCLYGCDEVSDKVSRETNSTKENRFIDTGDDYCIGELSTDIYYGRITNIVYITKDDYVGNCSYSMLSPFYNSEGKPMTIEEYNATK